MLDTPTLIALVIGVMSAATFLLVASAFAGGATRRTQRRLQQVSNRGKPAAARAADPAATRSLTRRDSNTPGLDRFFAMLPRKEALVERLSKTGREISVGQYGLITCGAILVTVAVIMFFFRLSLLPTLLFGTALGAFIPFYVVGRMGRKR